MIPLLGLITAGAAVGLLSSFFGVGGGIVAVPVMYELFPHLSAQTVIGSSLGMILFSSSLNLRNFIKAGMTPHHSLILPITLSMMGGVTLGGYLISLLSKDTVKLVFGTICLLVALRTIFFKVSPNDSQQWDPDQSQGLKLKVALVTFLGGIVSGLTGLGGGAVIVPLFISLIRLPFKSVSIYSNLAMIAGCMAGVILYSTKGGQVGWREGDILAQLQVGQVNWGIVMALFLGVMFLSKVGVKLNQKAPTHIIKNLFSALLTLIAIKIFFSVL